MLDPAEEPKSLTRSQTNIRLAVGNIENEWSRTSGLSSSDDFEILPRSRKYRVRVSGKKNRDNLCGITISL